MHKYIAFLNRIASYSNMKKEVNKTVMNGQGIYSFEELAALHAIARILAKPG